MLYIHATCPKKWISNVNVSPGQYWTVHAAYRLQVASCDESG